MSFLKLMMMGLVMMSFATASFATNQDKLVMCHTQPLILLIGSSVSHGSHLCTKDEDCGTNHKCCLGHCKRVDACS